VAALRTPLAKGMERRNFFRATAAALAVPKPAFAATTVAAAKASLLAAIPATATGAPATNATLPQNVVDRISASADALDAAAGMRNTAANKQLNGSWRLVYSDAPEITNLARLPLGFQLGPVRQPFSLTSNTFENQGEILHVTRLIHGATRVVGEFSAADRGTLNAAGVLNERNDRVDVLFRRVVFEIDAPLAIKTVVEPKPDPDLAPPAVDTVYLDDDLRVTRGGDGRPPASLLLFDGAQGGALFDPVFRTNTSTSQVALRAHARRRAGGHAHRGRAAGAIRRGEPRRRLRRRPGELEPLDPGRFLGRGRAGTGINK